MTCSEPTNQAPRNAISLSIEKGKNQSPQKNREKFYPGDVIHGTVRLTRREVTDFDKLLVTFWGGVVGEREEWFKVEADISSKGRVSNSGAENEKETGPSPCDDLLKKTLQPAVLYEFPFAIRLPMVNYPAPYGAAAFSQAYTLSAFLTFPSSTSFAATPMISVPFYPRLVCPPNKLLRPLLAVGSTNAKSEANDNVDPKEEADGNVQIGEVELEDAREGYGSNIALTFTLRDKSTNSPISIKNLSLSLIFDDVPSASEASMDVPMQMPIPDAHLATFQDLQLHPIQKITREGQLERPLPVALNGNENAKVTVSAPVPGLLPDDECVLKIDIEAVDGRKGITGWVVVLGEGVVDTEKGEVAAPTFKRVTEVDKKLEWEKPIFV